MAFGHEELREELGGYRVSQLDTDTDTDTDQLANDTQADKVVNLFSHRY
jgi:hypothetical protein